MVTSVKSKTTQRQEAAIRSIPLLVDELEVGARSLDENAINLLYGEYRAYYCSRRPFRSTIYKCKHLNLEHLFEHSGVKSMLKYLRVPQTTRKDEALCALQILLNQVRDTSSNKEATMA
ncbi:MAG: hypothetical protein WD061_00325 [Candidatus Saccharimonadales bacterium]